MKEDRIEKSRLHSEEMDMIIGETPGKLVRYGNYCFIAIIITALVVGWIVEYPDKIYGQCAIHSSEVPKAVISRVNGRIEKLVVSEGQHVKKNQVLGLLQSTTDFDEIERLSALIASIWKSIADDNWHDFNVSLADYKKLGELQSSFQVFYQDYVQIKSFIQSGLFNQKTALLNRGLVYNDSVKYIMNKQKEIYKQDYDIAKSDYLSKSKLFDDKVIAKAELRQEESKLLSRQIPIENIDASLLNHHAIRASTEKELLDLENRAIEIKSSFSQSLNKLYSDLESWKYEHLLTAPIEGVVVFSESVQENQEVLAGSELFFIEANETNYFARVLVDQTNFGKVERNQTVEIRLPSYPFQEYGFLNGKVYSISRIPNKEKQYRIIVKFNNGLVTSNGTSLKFANDLQAEAQIITKKTRLISKFLYSIEGYFNKSGEKKEPTTGAITNK